MKRSARQKVIEGCVCPACRRDRDMAYNNVNAALIDWEATMVHRGRTSGEHLAAMQKLLKRLVVEHVRMSMRVTQKETLGLDILTDMANWCDDIHAILEEKKKI